MAGLQMCVNKRLYSEAESQYGGSCIRIDADKFKGSNVPISINSLAALIATPPLFPKRDIIVQIYPDALVCAKAATFLLTTLE